MEWDTPIPSDFLNLPEGVVPLQVKQKVMTLSGPRPWKFWATVFWNWVVIAFWIGLAAKCDRIWVSAIAVLVIGTRQNILGLLVHEQCHRLGGKSAWFDHLSNLLVAYPLFAISIEGYRKVHLSHHRYFFTGKDPDFVRKQGPNWTFPMPVRRAIGLLVRDLSGRSTLDAIQNKNLRLEGNPWEPDPGFKRTARVLRVAFNLALAAVLTRFHLWGQFAVYWAIPLMTVLQVIIRWAAICEHRYDLGGSSPGAVTPFIRLSWWEKRLLPSLNFTTFHLYHHLFPVVSYGELPAVHRIFCDAGLVNEDRAYPGYAGFFRSLSRRTFRSPG